MGKKNRHWARAHVFCPTARELGSCKLSCKLKETDVRFFSSQISPCDYRETRGPDILPLCPDSGRNGLLTSSLTAFCPFISHAPPLPPFVLSPLVLVTHLPSSRCGGMQTHSGPRGRCSAAVNSTAPRAGVSYSFLLRRRSSLFPILPPL